VFITLVCMAVAERAGRTVSIWELRIPQADNPVLWEAVLMLFLVRWHDAFSFAPGSFLYDQSLAS